MEPLSSSASSAVIKKLPQDVIDKIAASQVLQRPSNAVKQLIENSLDADSNSILVEISAGGLSLIQVLDNGKGIHPSDFPLLCERFSTSKISKYEDLQSIYTFGFRGEALASLSYAADVQIVSKLRGELKAYGANFKSGKMLEDEPYLSRMNQGTKITAKNLFGSLSQIRKAALNQKQESKRIRTLIIAYAVHYSNVRFKFMTEKGMDFTTENLAKNNSTAKKQIYELLYQINSSDVLHVSQMLLDNTPSAFQLEALITKLNPESVNSRQLITFINNRLVESDEVRKAVERAYHNCYNSIHQQNQRFHCHISIKLDPSLVDCNVSPTKQTVGLQVHSYQIMRAIEESLSKKLRQSCSIKIISGSTPPVLFGNGGSKNIVSSYYAQKQQQLGFQKIRVDALQMPIKKYIPMPDIAKETPRPTHKPKIVQEASAPLPKQSANHSNVLPRTENIKLIRQFPKTSLTKSFIKKITYVGCHGLNYMFIHYEDKLYFMNLIPFLDCALTSWLKKQQKLYLHAPSQQTTVVQCLEFFKAKAQLDFPVVEFDAVLRANSKKVYEHVRVQIDQGTGRIVTVCAPMQFLQTHALNPVDLGYLLARIAKGLSSDPLHWQRSAKQMQQAESYLVQYLASLFVEESENTPSNNDYYNYFLQNKFLPHMKTDTDFSEIPFSQYIKQMLSLKKAYKLFERIC